MAPVLVAAAMLVALIVVGGAYAVDALTAGDDGPGGDRVHMPVGPAGRGSTQPGGGEPDPQERSQTLVLASARASCTAAPALDPSGAQINFRAASVIDADEATAWRCPGDGVGVTLSLRLSAQATVTRIGLIPGYAKTDPVDGSDRYAANRRLSRVRWTFAGGQQVVQRLDAGTSDRSVQWVNVPSVHTRDIGLEIIASSAFGSVDSVAVSSVLVKGTA